MQIACYSRLILIKHEFFRHIFEKNSNVQFHENLSNGKKVVPCQQTDVRRNRPDVGNNFFSQSIESS